MTFDLENEVPILHNGPLYLVSEQHNGNTAKPVTKGSAETIQELSGSLSRQTQRDQTSRQEGIQEKREHKENRYDHD